MTTPRFEDKHPFWFGVLAYCRDNNLDERQTRAVCSKTAEAVPDLHDEIQESFEKLGADRPWYETLGSGAMDVLGNTFGGIYGAAKAPIAGAVAGLSQIPRFVTAPAKMLGVPGAEAADAALGGAGSSLLDSAIAAGKDVGGIVGLGGRPYFGGQSANKALYHKRLRQTRGQAGGSGLITAGDWADTGAEFILPITGPGAVVAGTAKGLGALSKATKLTRAGRALAKTKAVAPAARAAGSVGRAVGSGARATAGAVNKIPGVGSYITGGGGARFGTRAAAGPDITGVRSLLPKSPFASGLTKAERAARVGGMAYPAGAIVGGDMSHHGYSSILDAGTRAVGADPFTTDLTGKSEELRSSGNLGRLLPGGALDPAFQADTDKFLAMAQTEQAALDQARELGRITEEDYQEKTKNLNDYYNQTSGQAASHKHMQKMVDEQDVLARTPEEKAVLDHWGRAFTPGTSINDEQFKAITDEQWKSIEGATPALIESITSMPDDDPRKPAAVRQVLRNRALLTSRDSGLAPKDLVRDIAARMKGIEEDGISTEEVQHLLSTNPDAQAAAGGAYDPVPRGGRGDAPDSPAGPEGGTGVPPVPPAAAPITEEQAVAQGLMPPSGVEEGTEVNIGGVPHVVQAGPDGSMQYVPVVPTDGGGGPRGGPETAPSPVTPADGGGIMDQVAGWYGGLDETSKMLLWIGVPLALAGVAMSVMGGEGGSGIGMLLAVLGIAAGGIGAFGGGDWLRNLFGLGGGAEDGSGGTRGSPAEKQPITLTDEQAAAEGLTPGAKIPPTHHLYDKYAPAAAADPQASPVAADASDASDAFPGDADGDGQISPQESVAAESNPAVLSQMINHPNASAVMLQQYQSNPKFKGKIDEIRDSIMPESMVIAAIKSRMKLTSDQDAKMMYDLAKGLAV